MSTSSPGTGAQSQLWSLEDTKIEMLISNINYHIGLAQGCPAS